MDDAWENDTFGDLSHGASNDGDLDNLSDLDEYNLGTDPNNPDTDSDGYTDGEEVYAATPTDPDDIGDVPAYAAGDYYADAAEQTIGLGTQAAPWQSLHHALDRVNNGAPGSAGSPYTLNIVGFFSIVANGGLEPDTLLEIANDYVTLDWWDRGDARTAQLDGTSATIWIDGIRLVNGTEVYVKNLEVANFQNGVNVLAPGSMLQDNTMENNTVGINSTEVDVTIDANRIDNNPIGISMTGSSQGALTGSAIYNNVIYSCDNGIYIDSSLFDFSLEIFHNTIDSGTGTGIWVKGPNAVPDIQFNNITNLDTGINNDGGNPSAVDYNNVWGNTTDYTGLVAGTNDISVDPLYIDPDPGAGDYRLQSASFCIDVIPNPGTPPVEFDYDGIARPQGPPAPSPRYDKIDIGALEYVYTDVQDGDGIDDAWEFDRFADYTHDGATDQDGDGLSDKGEYDNKTDAYIPDTDNDGYYDGEEVNIATPTDPNNAADMPVYNLPEYWVDAGNTQLGDGTSGNPWLSIHHAVHHVNNGNVENVTVHVAAGLYSILTNEPDEPFQITKNGTRIIGEDISVTLSGEGTPASWVNGIEIVNVANVEITNFEIRNFDSGNGIFIQDCGPTITRNIIHDCGLYVPDTAGIYVKGINLPASPVIINNLIYIPGDYGIYMTALTRAVNAAIHHNTLEGAAKYCVVISDSGENMSAPEIKFNIISNFAVKGIYNTGATPVVDYNDVWSNTGTDYVGLSAGANDISADPLYMDPGTGNYAPQVNSPCVDPIPLGAGDPVTEDIDLTTRPLRGLGPGIGFDMGAYEYGTDSDNDGMDDDWEITFFGDITSHDGTADSDLDALIDSREYTANTDPTVADTDKDGLQDGEEVDNYITDPLNDDTDNDGYSDGEEIDQLAADPLDDTSYPSYAGRAYYVDMTYDGIGLGTQGSPWQSLHHAIHHINAGIAGDAFTINVTGGLYNVNEGDTALLITHNDVIISGDTGDTPTELDGTGAGTWTTGIEIQGSSVEIHDVLIHDFADFGVNITGGAGNVLDACTVYSNDTGVRIGPGSGNNYIQNGCEIYENTTVGISINDSASNQVINNPGSIYNNGGGETPGNGISITGPNAQNNIIVGNSLYWTRLLSNKQGNGIYLDNCGAGNEIRANTISYNLSAGIFVLETSPLIEKNTIQNNYFGIDINASSGDASPNVLNNVIYGDASSNFDIGIRVGTDTTGTASPQIDHNTIDGAESYGIYLEETGGSSQTSPVIVHNNITNFIQNAINCNIATGTPNIDYNNLYPNNGSEYTGNCGAATNDIPGDPAYLSPGTGDYHPGPGSASIDAIPLDAGDSVAEDLDGTVRPQEFGYDTGAFEYMFTDTDSDGMD
ncbi:MAG: hypothetical protein GXP02_07335, partial [Alphaproteobacteria bacterium]|nr:hypothetical protein [Alphaproteobacteria bacterium]